MADDPHVGWQQSVPFGIYNDGDWAPAQEGEWSAWHAGRVRDVLTFPDDSVLIAVEHGGLWRGSADGRSTQCVTNDVPAHLFNRLSFGPSGPDHVFAGGESLWVTDPSDPLPLVTWQQIASFRFGTVQDILVLNNTVIVAADGGIWWADVPPPPQPRGCLGLLLGSPPAASSLYQWRQALIVTSAGRVPTDNFYSLAEGRSERRDDHRARYRTVLAGSGGTVGQQGIFQGGWDAAGDLVFSPSTLMINGADETKRFVGTGRIAVASCLWDTERAYAAADRAYVPADPKGGHLALLLRSADGGRTWNPCGSKILLDTKTDMFAKCDHQPGSQILSVAPANGDVVAFGWFDAYVSFDGGDTWEAPGCNDNFNPDNSHIHTDIHGLRLLPPTDPDGRTPPQRMRVGCDGGSEEISWGHGASFIEGGFRSDGHHGDLEAVVLEGNTLMHYRRPSATGEWIRSAIITNRATGRGCIIQGDFGASSVKNFEVVVPEGPDLVHYWRENSGTSQGWHRAKVVSSGVTGSACMIQSNYPEGNDHGNFEVVALEGSDLVHYWRDNGDVNNSWQRGVTITNHAASSASMIQSDFELDADHGNFELVVVEDERGIFGRALVHYWRDNAGKGDWKGPALITRDVTGPAWLFQSDYPLDAEHHNFELFVQQSDQLWHWIRANDAPGMPWMQFALITALGDKVSGPACAFQGNYGNDAHHGNIELLAPYAGRLFHYWRDDGAGGKPWHKSVAVTSHAYHYFTGWNRQSATLMFNKFVDTELPHGQFGASTAVDGLLAGGLQDNGVVAGLSEPNPSPWVAVSGDDGHEAVFPAARSRALGDLAGGALLVSCHSAEGGAPSSSLGDPNSGIRPTTPRIIPLTRPDPTLTPAPPSAAGLTGDPRLGPVTSPQYVENSAVLQVLGAPVVGGKMTRAAIYGLFIDAPVRKPREQPDPPKADWRFLAALAVPASKDASWPINALASPDGGAVYLAATVDPNARVAASHIELLQLDVATGNISWMPTDPAVGFPQVNWIEAVTLSEAYAVTDDGQVLLWNGKSWSRPGKRPDGSSSLIGLAVRPTTGITAVFVITGDKVFVSRDLTQTWSPAMKGLPRSIECTNLHLVTDPQGTAHLHLSTYGRSTWSADVTEPN